MNARAQLWRRPRLANLVRPGVGWKSLRCLRLAGTLLGACGAAALGKVVAHALALETLDVRRNEDTATEEALQRLRTTWQLAGKPEGGLLLAPTVEENDARYL